MSDKTGIEFGTNVRPYLAEIALERWLAARGARALIAESCVVAEGDPETGAPVWFDLRMTTLATVQRGVPTDRVPEAVRWLEAWRLVECHPTREGWVRLLPDPPEGLVL